PLPGGPGGGPGSGPGRPPIVAGRAPSPGASTHMVPAARVRYNWRDPGGRAALDLRGTHALLDASPFLVRNDVERTEVGGEGQLRIVGPLAMRALVRHADLHSALDANNRMTLGGRLVVSTRLLGELSGGLQQLAYAHASSAGYFAPKWARTAEIGVYREIEFDRGATLAFDACA